MIPVTQLECPTTRDALPMCIISGRHMVLDDWCFCPISKFPALYSEYVRYIREQTKRLDSTSREEGKESTRGGAIILPQHRISSSEPETDEPEEVRSTNNNTSNALVSATDMFLSAPDPIFGKSVSVSDLILCTREEATKYIQRYNNVFEKKKEENTNNNQTEGGEDENNNKNEEGKSGGDKSPTKERGDESDNGYSSPVKGKKGSVGMNPMNNSNSKEDKNSRSRIERIQRQRRRRNNQQQNR